MMIRESFFQFVGSGDPFLRYLELYSRGTFESGIECSKAKDLINLRSSTYDRLNQWSKSGRANCIK